ncbi:MAG: efflux RND transporter permease subunit [Oligoflexia bacterium]|nr:efflux RND transporter permease subunit [Oligoflexia bacterium]
MKKLFEKFVDNSFLVNTLSAFMIIIGFIAIMNMKRDLIPQFQNNRIQISTSLTGASSDQMEKFITYPLEEAVQSFAGIDEISSTSRAGSTQITLKIKDGFDEVDDLVEKVKTAIQNVEGDLPEDTDEVIVKNEKMTSFWFSSIALMGIDRENPTHILFKDELVKEIKKLDGIVEVSDRSGKKSLFVKFIPEKLSQYRLTMNDIVRSLKGKFEVLPLGMIDRGQNDISVQVDNELRDLAQIENTIIKGNASQRFIRLKEIATVEYRYPKRTYKGYTNGEESINIHLFKDLDTDTIELKERAEALFTKMRKKAPEGAKILTTGDGPAYIERQLNVLNSNGLFGLILVGVVLCLFLGFRSAVMTALGLPLAYFSTFFFLSHLGINIDLISVVGMILILGILVDDAIVVSEQYTQFVEKGYVPREAALKAIQTTIIPITGAILTTAVAFVPILFGEDGLSHILRAIPLVVIISLALSWFESFFILPNHLVHFAKADSHKDFENRKIFKRTLSGYKKLLSWALKGRYFLTTGMVIFMGFTLWFAKEKVPMKFDLRIGSEKVRVLVELTNSESIEETEKQLKPIWDIINKIDKSRYSYVSGNLGYAYINGTSYNDLKYSNIAIRFNQTHPNIEEDKAYIEEFIKNELDTLQKSQADVYKMLKVDKRMDGHDDAKDHTLKIKVTSDKPFEVESVLNQVKASLKDVKDKKDIFVDPNLMQTSWKFIPNIERIEEYSISTRDVVVQISGYIRKRELHEVRMNGTNISIYGYFQDNENLKFEDLSLIKIDLGNGQMTKASNLGTWVQARTLQKISHTNLLRTTEIEVTYDEKKVKKEKFQKELETAIAPLQKKMPLLTFNIGDADEQAQKNKNSMLTKVLYSVVLILFILAMVLQSFVQPLLIGSAIPFGIIGVIWAFYFHGQSIDVMGIVGIIGMAGVVVNDSLMLVDTVNKKRKSWLSFKREDIIEGTASRLRPIVLTSLTTLGGVFPMAYGIGGDSGFTKPLALSMGWGLLFATTLTLFVLPAMLEIQREIMVFAIKLKNKLLKKKTDDNEEMIISEISPAENEEGKKKGNKEESFIQKLPSGNENSGDQLH